MWTRLSFTTGSCPGKHDGDPAGGRQVPAQHPLLGRHLLQGEGGRREPQDGRYGLYAPCTGGMEMLDLRTGKVCKTLIPKVGALAATTPGRRGNIRCPGCLQRNK